jgi:putative endopeptidase
MALLVKHWAKMYVEEYFPASSKERMLQLVKNLQKSLAQRIQGLSWMSEVLRKQKALGETCRPSVSK